MAQASWVACCHRCSDSLVSRLLSSLVDCSHCSDAQALISYVVCPGQVIGGGSAFDGAAIAGKASSSSNRFMAQYSLVFKF